MKIIPKLGRRALLGQQRCTQIETDIAGAVIRRIDQSFRFNYDQSKKYPHSNTRQQERERRKA